jgi:DNA-directed RNA polymerase specialized sigma24 family protein
MRAFTHIGTFDGRSAFSPWVTRIAINSALGMISLERSESTKRFRWMILPILIGPDLRRCWNFREIRKSDAWKGKY